MGVELFFASGGSVLVRIGYGSSGGRVLVWVDKGRQEGVVPIRPHRRITHGSRSSHVCTRSSRRLGPIVVVVIVVSISTKLTVRWTLSWSTSSIVFVIVIVVVVVVVVVVVFVISSISPRKTAITIAAAIPDIP